MSVIKNCVLLLKSQKTDEANDQYEELLTANGYDVHQIKTLVFAYNNLEILAKKLHNVDNYTGIILSSPRCVNAVHLALDGCNLDARWRSKENFVVGEATFEAAKRCLSLVCKGSETGNANNLADIIIDGICITFLKEKQTNTLTFFLEKESYCKPFLFPHGNLRTGTLHERFKEVGLELDETLVYETIPNSNIQTEFALVTKSFSALPEFIVFFSPSGVLSALDSIKKVPVDWSLLKVVCTFRGVGFYYLRFNFSSLL